MFKDEAYLAVIVDDKRSRKTKIVPIPYSKDPSVERKGIFLGIKWFHLWPIENGLFIVVIRIASTL